jgi:hypothetical protein
MQERFCNGEGFTANDAQVIEQFLQDPDVRINNLANALEFIRLGQPEKMQLALSTCTERNRRRLVALMGPYQELQKQIPIKARPAPRAIPAYEDFKGKIPTYRVEMQRVVRAGPEL